jgi:hypothetical protein
MNTITLQPITITFKETSKFSVEDYLEWCMDTDNTPSQKGYKRYVIDAFEDDLRDDIDTNNFTFKYGKEKEYEYEETEIDENETPFDYSKWVSDLSESEIEEFHKLLEMDKFSINPRYAKDDVVIMNTIENPSLYYGVKIDKENSEFLYIKKSIYTHHLYEYLRTLPKPSQGLPTGAPDAL